VVGEQHAIAREESGSLFPRKAGEIATTSESVVAIKTHGRESDTFDVGVLIVPGEGPTPNV
jgi:hypothetical protein